MNNQHFQNILFPEEISYGSVGGPVFFTEVQTAYNGYEYRNVNWQASRAQYHISYGIQNVEQLEQLIAFFRLCQGRALGFRFKDWADFSVQAQEMLSCPGDPRIYHMVKWYQNGETATHRRTFKPRENTVSVWLEEPSSQETKRTPHNPRTEAVSDPVYQIDYDMGLIIFDVAPDPATKVKATFNFDVPVRFDVDYLPISIEGYARHHAHDIRLVELRYLDPCVEQKGGHDVK